MPFLLPHLRPGMSLLDCGCGVGSITLDLAERVLDVAGGSGAVTRQAAHAVDAAGKVVELDINTFAHATTLIDKTGHIHRLVMEKGRIPPQEQDRYIRAALDGYINGVYRSAKCWHVQNALGAQLEAMDSIGCVLSLIFGLEGRLRPYYGYLAWELHAHPLQRFPLSGEALLAAISRILTTGDLPTQQALLRTVESVCRADGHGEVIDAWGPDYPWMVSFQPGTPAL